jgi:hypothetical protein
VIVPLWQAFYKPLPGMGAAIFIANHADTPQDITVDFSTVPGLGHQAISSMTSSVSPAAAGPTVYDVTDVWAQAAIPGKHSSYTATALASHDSVFITLAPA